MRISFLGFIGQYPMAGVTPYFRQYALGLQRRGHDVFYIEDSGTCPYDPIHDTISMDVSYSLTYLKRHLEPYGLAERWTYADYDSNYYGMSKAQTLDVLHTSDL